MVEEGDEESRNFDSEKKLEKKKKNVERKRPRNEDPEIQLKGSKRPRVKSFEHGNVSWLKRTSRPEVLDRSARA